MGHHLINQRLRIGSPRAYFEVQCPGQNAKLDRKRLNMEGLIGLIITVPIGIAVGAATIGLGIKWGGTWLLRAIASDHELADWIKRVFNTEK